MSRALPVIDGPDGVITVGADPSTERRLARRDQDRRIAVGGIVLSLTFVALALATLLAGGERWTALHLLLAGSAGTAIGAVMPFFAAALAGAPPADPRARMITIGCLAIGALTIALAVPAGGRAGSLLGAGLYLLGLAGLAVVTLGPSRRGLRRPRRTAVLGGYAMAIVFVASGVILVMAMLYGFEPVASRWALLKPAHAWLNLIGFVGLVYAATVTHLVPTVLGARIVEGRVALTAIVGLAVGVAGVASGFVLGSDPLVRVGAVAALIGALAVPATVLAAATQTGRGRWTADADWHVFTSWTLSASAVWFAVGVGLAAALAIRHGATPDAWSLPIVGVPLAIGCVLQAVVGAASHLLPTLADGTPADRSRARSALGRAALPRVWAFQLGVVLLLVSSGPGQVLGMTLGGLLAAAPVAMMLGLLVSTRVPWGSGRADRPSTS